MNFNRASLRRVVTAAQANVTPESREVARFIDALTERNTTLAEYEENPQFFSRFVPRGRR